MVMLYAASSFADQSFADFAERMIFAIAVWVAAFSGSTKKTRGKRRIRFDSNYSKHYSMLTPAFEITPFPREFVMYAVVRIF